MKGYRALLVAVVMATPLAQSGSLAASTLEPEHYRVPQREGVASEVRTIGDETVFSIRGRTIDNHIVIDLGSMPAEPNKQYRARYRARSPKPGEGATIYLMIREHEVQQAKPT